MVRIKVYEETRTLYSKISVSYNPWNRWRIEELEQFYRRINAVTVDVWKYVNTLKRSLCLVQIPAPCCAVAMESMRRVTVCVGMAGREQSVTSQRSSASTPPALATAPASWASASACLATRETSVRKVCALSFSLLSGVDLCLEFPPALRWSEAHRDVISFLWSSIVAQNYLYCLTQSNVKIENFQR